MDVSGPPPWRSRQCLCHQEANVRPRKFVAGALILIATAVTCPCSQAVAGVLITHPLASDLPEGRTPTATPVPRAAVRHAGAASSTAASPPAQGGLGPWLGAEAKPQA